jgi:hypothetical protein
MATVPCVAAEHPSLAISMAADLSLQGPASFTCFSLEEHIENMRIFKRNWPKWTVRVKHARASLTKGSSSAEVWLTCEVSLEAEESAHLSKVVHPAGWITANPSIFHRVKTLHCCRCPRERPSTCCIGGEGAWMEHGVAIASIHSEEVVLSSDEELRKCVRKAG